MKHFILAGLTLVLPLTTFAGMDRSASCRIILSQPRNEAALAPILGAKGYELITAKKYEAMMNKYIKTGGYLMMDGDNSKKAKTWAELKTHSKNQKGVIEKIESQARAEFGILEIFPPFASDLTQAKGAQLFIRSSGTDAKGTYDNLYNKRLVLPLEDRKMAKIAGNKLQDEMKKSMQNPEVTDAQRKNLWDKYLADLDAQGEFLMFKHLPSCAELHKQMVINE